MTAPLARDQHGVSFEVLPEATHWRVRRHTGGRPSTVLGADGEPLFVPIQSDRMDLRASGCEPGSLRLEAVDEQRKPVGAPVAVVELVAAEERTAVQGAAIGHGDLVRVSFESMTRTMEAMQRAQVERERALAQKERALADAQVSMQRMNTDLMIALIERTAGGKPQTPLAVLKEQQAFQRALDNGARRNADLLLGPDDRKDKAEDDGQSLVASIVKPLVPVLAGGAQELMVNMLAKGDPLKAAVLRKGFASAYAQYGGVQKLPTGSDALGDAAGTHERLPRGRAVREVLAALDDKEAEAFDMLLDQLSDGQYADVHREADALSSTEERLAWARGYLHSTAPEAATADLSQIPSSLLSLMAQLTPDEIQTCTQVVSTLDVATTNRLKEQLSALPADEALTRVRSMIAEARRRSASVAQRAVMAAMNGAAVPGGAL